MLECLLENYKKCEAIKKLAFLYYLQKFNLEVYFILFILKYVVGNLMFQDTMCAYLPMDKLELGNHIP